MAETITPNLGMTLPEVGVTTGTQYAIDINAALEEKVDPHDHSPGFGAPVATAGLNINADLSFQSNNATTLRSTQYDSQTVALDDPSDLRCVYSVGKDLYYNDGDQNQIRITQDGSVAAAAGNITGLVSPAAVNYASGSGTFTFAQDATTPANLSGGAVSIVEAAAGRTNAITLQSPASLAASYTLTMPAALPASTKFLTVSSAGVVGDAYDVDNSTLQVAANVLAVKSGGITRTQQAAVGQQVSATCGVSSTSSASMANLSTSLAVTLTTYGRPVVVALVPDSSGSFSGFQSYGNGDGVNITAGGQIQILVTGSATATIGSAGWYEYLPSATVTTTAEFKWGNPFSTLYVASAGTYTFTVQSAKATGSVSFSLRYMKLVAYEL